MKNSTFHSYPESGSVKRRYLCALLVLVCIPQFAHSLFNANIAGSPNLNSGDYTVSWDNPLSYSYTLQELIVGGSTWTNIVTTTGTSHAFSGIAPNDYMYRLRYKKLVCTGNPEPSCNNVTNYP